MCIVFCTYVCTTCLDARSQNWASDSLELESQTFVKLGIVRPGPPKEPPLCALNHGATSPVSHTIQFINDEPRAVQRFVQDHTANKAST